MLKKKISSKFPQSKRVYFKDIDFYFLFQTPFKYWVLINLIKVHFFIISNF